MLLSFEGGWFFNYLYCFEPKLFVLALFSFQYFRLSCSVFFALVTFNCFCMLFSCGGKIRLLTMVTIGVRDSILFNLSRLS